MRSINAKDFGKPGVWCIVRKIGLCWCDTSDMAVRRTNLSLQSWLVEWMTLLGKDLKTQSAHPVWAVVVTTDTAECCDFGFQMTAGLCWKGSYVLWLDTVAVQYVSHGATFWVILHNWCIESRLLPLMTTSQFDGKGCSSNDFDGLGSLAR